MEQAHERDHAKDNAAAWLETIKEFKSRYEAAESDEEKEGVDEEMRESVLEVSVRSDWHIPGDASNDEEYKLLLTTGGPALRIIGGLSQYGEPDSARLEFQDWGTPWTEYRLTAEEEQDVLAFAGRFYFGE